MRFLRRLWLKKQPKSKIEEKNKIEVSKILATYPVRDYLIALMDELVRQGIYLDKEKQIGAKFTIDLLTKEIQKGEEIFKKEEKMKEREEKMKQK